MWHVNIWYERVKSVSCSNEIKGGRCSDWGMHGCGQTSKGTEISEALRTVIKGAAIGAFRV